MVQRSLTSRNSKSNHTYLFKSLCFDSITKQKLKNRSVVKSNKTYLYYVNDKEERINQDIIDDELVEKLDWYIREEVALKAERRVRTLKKRDSQINEIDYFFDIGLIDEYYYIEQKKKLVKNIKDNEKILISMLTDLPNWSTMSYIQKRKFLVMNISCIEIDVIRKKVINITFINHSVDNGCIGNGQGKVL